jgi:hypothetical protein
MSIQLGALREALMDPGNEAKANKAAEEVAGYENRFAAADVKFERLEGKITLLQVTTTITLGIVISIALKLFVP